MKKIVFLAVFMANLAFCDGFFVGLEGAMAWQEVKQKDGVFLKANGASGGLKAGYDFDISRIYAGFNYNGDVSDKKRYLQSYDIIAGVDFTPEIISGFKFLGGVYTGLSFCDLSDENKHSNTNLPLFGAKLGAVFDINPLNSTTYETHSIEFGVKFDTGFFKKNSTFNTELKTQKTAIYLGYSYKF